MSYTELLTKLCKLCHYFYLNMVRFFKLTELYQPTYNPNKLYFVREARAWRNCDDRIKVISNEIDLSQVSSYLDVGSQLGYFVLKLTSEQNIGLGVGIEMDSIACNYASSLVALNGFKNVSFVNTEINAQTVKSIPSADLISLLSVFHHLVYFKGYKEADEVMRGLYKKCNSYFVFETGQFDEKGYYWSDALSFMGNDPEVWLIDYLKSLGYRDINVAARFPSHLTGRPRSFFVCKK